jgi:CRP-like cAMP-binding protein
MAGLPAFHRAERCPTRVYCQVPPCVCTRLPADRFVEASGRPGPLQDLCHRYAQALANQTSQSVACNRLHPVERRLARWMLMTHDRVNGDAFPLTQQILSEMLGCRRASVTEAAGALQKAGLISYKRGVVTVKDRLRLEEVSCECYRVVRAEFDRLVR